MAWGQMDLAVHILLMEDMGFNYNLHWSGDNPHSELNVLPTVIFHAISELVLHNKCLDCLFCLAFF